MNTHLYHKNQPSISCIPKRRKSGSSVLGRCCTQVGLRVSYLVVAHKKHVQRFRVNENARIDAVICGMALNVRGRVFFLQ